MTDDDIPTNVWVRYVDGKFIVTWQNLGADGEWQHGGKRQVTVLVVGPM